MLGEVWGHGVCEMYIRRVKKTLCTILSLKLFQNKKLFLKKKIELEN